MKDWVITDVGKGGIDFGLEPGVSHYAITWNGIKMPWALQGYNSHAVGLLEIFEAAGEKKVREVMARLGGVVNIPKMSYTSERKFTNEELQKLTK